MLTDRVVDAFGPSVSERDYWCFIEKVCVLMMHLLNTIYISSWSCFGLTCGDDIKQKHGLEKNLTQIFAFLMK